VSGYKSILSTYHQFIEIKLPAIEATEIVDHGDSKFHGIVGFKEKTLIALYGKGSAMSFAEAEISKTFNLSPDFFRGLLRISEPCTISKKTFPSTALIASSPGIWYW
jgi:hypothetical protein